MSYLIDTNVVSEIRKGGTANAQVAAWWSAVAEDELWTSTLVLGEIRKGIERTRRRDPSKARALEQWLDTLTTHFENRALAVDTAVAEAWGCLNGPRPLPVVDSLLAATAIVHDLTLVTRNTADIEGTGVATLNPWY